MVRKRKKAWGPSNPLWRYLNGKKRSKRRGSKPKRSYRRKVTNMARRRSRKKSYRKSGSSWKAMAKNALAGMGLGLTTGPVLGTGLAAITGMGLFGAGGAVLAQPIASTLANLGAQANNMIAGFTGGNTSGGNSSAAW